MKKLMQVLAVAGLFLVAPACQQSESVAPDNTLSTAELEATTNTLVDAEAQMMVQAMAAAITEFNQQHQAQIATNGKVAPLQMDALMQHVQQRMNELGGKSTFIANQSTAEGDYTVEGEATMTDLSPEALTHVDSYLAQIDEMGAASEEQALTDEEVLTGIQDLNAQYMAAVAADNRLTEEEKSGLYNAFYSNNELAQPMYESLALSQPGATDARFWRRLGRALARVAVAVVVTAVVIAVPVAAVAVAKVGLKAGAVKVAGAVGKAVAKATIGAGKKGGFFYSSTAAGLAYGSQNAVAGWDTKWKGAEEFKFKFKYKF